MDWFSGKTGNQGFAVDGETQEKKFGAKAPVVFFPACPHRHFNIAEKQYFLINSLYDIIWS
jgi:hypothetical protein